MRQCAQFQFRMPGHPFCIVIIQRDHVFFRHIALNVAALINLAEAKIYILFGFIHLCVTAALDRNTPVFVTLIANVNHVIP